MRLLISFCLSLFCSFSAWAEDAALRALFLRVGATGTMVIAPVQDGPSFIHDERRASRRLPAASTFKILNTLIALEENVVAVADTLKWDGVTRDIPDWNRDQSLTSAFRSSCVWCYQALARKVGVARYKHHLAASAYGELREPFDVSMFWLDGSLRISAVEQVDFLRKVQRRSLAFKESSYENLRQIMLVEKGLGFSLYAKTGWATSVQSSVGWYVGYVETPKGTWLFAMNLDTRDAGDLPLRQTITREALQVKGIID